MFSSAVNIACNNALFSYRTMLGMESNEHMHPSAVRLYAVAKESGDAETAQIARRMNISIQRVQNWEKRGISKQGALQAESVYRCNAPWLLGLSSTKNPLATSADMKPVALLETPKSHVRFGLLEGFAGMGRGDYVGDYPEAVDFVEVTKEWAAHKLHGVPHNAIRVITGRGQSMRGTYNDGDLIFVDARVKEFVDDAAYVFRRAGRVQIKRLQWRGGKLRIISSNKEYEPEDVDPNELEIGGMALAAWTFAEF